MAFTGFAALAGLMPSFLAFRASRYFLIFVFATSLAAAVEPERALRNWVAIFDDQAAVARIG